MMSEHPHNPWEDLETPGSQTTMNSKRVHFEYPWDFFWAKDVRGSAILLLRHEESASTTQEFPKLRGLDIESVPANSSGQQLLLFRLLDAEHLEVFHHLCLDIMNACRDASNISAVVDIAVRRTWRWHQLLSGGRSRKMTVVEQQGLIAELFVLKRRLFACLPELDGLKSWTGPEGHPRDFEVGRIGIEAKARRGSSRGFIEISSADQLDIKGADAVFLSVTELDPATEAVQDAFTLDDVIASIEYELNSKNLVEELELWSARLYRVGYDKEHDYSSDLWIEGRTALFKVTDSFPRIEAGQLAPGVGRVRYSIQLSAIEGYRVTEADVSRALTKDRGVAS